jgi:RNA polymerase sigma-70 factor (ECF subfamily)
VAEVFESEPDEILLARLSRRDPEALDALYTRYGRLAFALAYRVLGSPEAAEDAVQEAFLSIWRAAETYQQARGAARGWLLSVVRNRAIDMLRAREARPKVGATLDQIASLAADQSDPAEDALRRVEAVKVREALAALPEEQRHTVELAFFSGLTYPEVAARMGAPLGTVKSRMRLALERLRGLLLAEDAVG